MISEPGLYTDIATRTAYHADPCPEPSLSRSIARILAERTPRHAWHAHPRLNPDYEQEHAEKFDLGEAAHTMLLGHGAEIVIIPADDWKTKAARELRDSARAEGLTPMLAHQHIEAQQMVRAVRGQLADFGLSEIFSDETGRSEVVAACIDPVAGWCRIMIDRLMSDLTIWDVKTTTVDLTDESLSRHMSNMGYEFQHGFYERVLVNLFPSLAGRVQFNFLFIENAAPFAIRPVKLSNAAIAKGRAGVDVACERWAEAKRTGRWPMYSGDVATIEYPVWKIAEWAGDVNG